MSSSVEISPDAFASLTALLDERRRMVKRHERERSRKRGSRYQGGLTEKLLEKSRQKLELDDLNAKIDELMNQGGDL